MAKYWKVNQLNGRAKLFLRNGAS